MTINQAIKLDQYPIPKMEDLLPLLAGGKSSTKLDLKQAYLPLALERESQKLAVININRRDCFVILGCLLECIQHLVFSRELWTT